MRNFYELARPEEVKAISGRSCNLAGRALLLQALVERAELAAASPYGGKHACRAAIGISPCHVFAVGHRLLFQPVQQSCVPRPLVSSTA